MTTAAAFEHIMHDMNGFRQAAVLAALSELDLGTLVLEHGNSLSAGDIARLGSCDLRGCTALLDALAALGYFGKRGSGEDVRYFVAEAYRECLDSRHPESAIPILRHLACVQRSWARLSWTVRQGVPPEKMPSILGREEDRVSFIMGMNAIAIRMLPPLLRALDASGVLDFGKEHVRILDVGGASGTYTEAFLKRIPDSSAAIFDLPAGIAQARRRFAGSELESRVTLVEGDFTLDELPSGFDFAWVSAIIHQMNREESRDLYMKILSALNPAGMIAIRDFVMHSDRTAPVDGTLFGINMLVNTKNGMVYTLEEIREDLELAGFEQVCHAVDVPTMGAVVVAKKPA